MYTRVSDQGIQEVVAAMIPDTPAAGRAMRSWLHAPKPQERTMNTASGKRLKKAGDFAEVANNYDCGMDGQYDCVILIWEDGNITLICYPKMCLWANTMVEQHDDGLGGGDDDGPVCRDFPEMCESNSGFTSNVPTYTDCSGVLNGLAYMDPVCPGRCVGGTTGRLPASVGADCDELNLPCAGDVVKNPEITSSSRDNPDDKTGGRFRPCVGSSCAEGTKAVRKDGTRPHRGTDISCTEGDPIYAPFDMDGLEIGYQVNTLGRGYGYWVRGWTTINGERLNFGVAHLQRDGRPSGPINAGDIIGICGRSGITDRRVTTHAHLELGTRVVFFSGTHDYLRNPELVLSTKFSNNAEATPINANPCGQ